MAQIPVFQDAQVLQPSAPVQIGNVDTTTQEAFAGFGKALVQLGSKLDEVQKRALGKTREYEGVIASQMFEEEMRLFNQEKLWQNKSDITGLDAAKISLEHSAKVKEKIIKQFGFGGDEALKFEASARNINNNLFPELMKQSSKIVADNYEATKTRMVNGAIAKVFNDPSKFSSELASLQEMISNDPDTLNKEEQIMKVQRSLADGALSKLVSSNRFNEAKSFLTSETVGPMFGPDIGKEFDKIEKAEMSFANNYWDNQRNAYTLEQRAFKDNRDKAMTTYTQMLEKAGNNQAEFNVVIEKAKADPRLKDGDLIGLSKTTAFKETKDDTYEGNIFAAINSKKLNAATATEKIERDFANNLVSPERRTKILKALEDVKAVNKKNPSVEKLVSQYYKKIDTLAAPRNAFDIDAKYNKGVYDIKRDTAKIQFGKKLAELATSGKYSPSSIDSAFKSVMDDVYPGDPLAKATGFGGKSKDDIPKGVKAEIIGNDKALRDEIKAEALFAAKQGKSLSGAEKSEMARRILWYNNQLKNIEQKKQKDALIKPDIEKSGKN